MENHEIKQALLGLLKGVQADRDALYRGGAKQKEELGTLQRWARGHFPTWRSGTATSRAS